MQKARKYIGSISVWDIDTKKKNLINSIKKRSDRVNIDIYIRVGIKVT